MIVHPIPPVCGENAEILILGSFPSVKSREQGFFYGHPQNRFWKMLAAVLDEPVPQNVTEKKELLLRNHIALWDVIASCEITGSSDASIRDVTPNDISALLERANIRRILCNGNTAFRLYRKYILPQTGREALCLPSTSPANAACGLEALKTTWKNALHKENAK